MITMRIKGGLGNQLFQYAAAYALANRLNQPFGFNPSFSNNMTPRGYKLSYLKTECDRIVKDDELPYKVNFLKKKYPNKLLRVMNHHKTNCGKYAYWIETRDEWQPNFFKIDYPNIYVDGYFQSQDYFKEYRESLLKQFLPSYEPEIAFIDAQKKIHLCNSVAVHVRRSDFTKDGHAYHYLLDKDYYISAVSFMKAKLETPTFFWFSDDINWVKHNIGDNKDFVFVNIQTPHCDIDDMMLMKSCKHIITANSTFSWWAAWLNENNSAIKIVPQKPYGMDGMIPNEWIKL